MAPSARDASVPRRDAVGTAPRAQWSRDSWGRVLGTVLALFLAWWPVAAIQHIAILCRFGRGPELAIGYIVLAGSWSWLLALLIAGFLPPREGSVGRSVVFALCLLPPAVILLRMPVYLARWLYP